MFIVIYFYFILLTKYFCHNLSLRLTTNAKACKGEDQEGNLGVTSHAPGNVGECEGMNLHTPK
jgi:hypothetical protein